MSRWNDPRFPPMQTHWDPHDRMRARKNYELNEPLDPGNAAPRTVDPSYATQVKFGNTLTLDASNGGDRRQLLSADLARLEQAEQWHSGAWVLSLQSRLSGALNNSPCLATAEISMGAGGTNTTFEVSAFPGFTLQVPSSYLTVTLKWDPLLIVGGQRSPGGINLTVIGLLQRGETQRSARRVIYLPFTAEAQAAGGDFWLSGSLASGNITGRIPDFARSVRPIGDSEVAPIFDPTPGTAFLELRPPTTGVDMSGFALKQLMLSGDSLPIPGGAFRWRLATATTGATVCGLDFEIAL